MTATTLRILLVEDDGSIARIIALSMHALGVPYHLDQAYSAEEGLDLWKQHAYDLVISDYNLRGMNGLVMIAALKAQAASLPTILFTAYDDAPVRREAKQVGVSRFIAKPFVIDEFIDVVRSLLPAHSTEVNGHPSP